MPLSDKDIYDLMKSMNYDAAGITAPSLAEVLGSRFDNLLHKQILPDRNESIAISLFNPKIAALAHDRVLRLSRITGPIPEEIGFYCATRPEQDLVLADILLTLANILKIPQIVPNNIDKSTIADDHDHYVRRVRRHIQLAINNSPVIYYDSATSFSADFHNGPQQVLTAAIENVAMVDEDALTWEQVLEFRKDTEARAKYKRLVRWIDEELKSKSPEAILDLIAVRLDDYKWSCKKHGFKTVTGALSCIMDPKFLLAASTLVGASKYAGGDLWAALSGATIAIGGAAVSFGKSYIDSLDERRKENYEVAYIHDIKKKVT